MIVYCQNPPSLSQGGVMLAPGGLKFAIYSGFGLGKNSPAWETVPDVGPIPRGRYRVVRWDDQHAEKGPQVAVLEPVGHDAHGRSDFLGHGDSAAHIGFASHGCIVAARQLRDAWRETGDMDLLVV